MKSALNKVKIKRGAGGFILLSSVPPAQVQKTETSCSPAGAALSPATYVMSTDRLFWLGLDLECECVFCVRRSIGELALRLPQSHVTGQS